MMIMGFSELLEYFFFFSGWRVSFCACLLACLWWIENGNT